MPHEDFNKLNDKNWSVWSYQMEMLLEKMDLWDVVSGEETRPLGSVSMKPVKLFLKKQWLAHAKIALQVTDLQLVHARVEDPHEIWEKSKAVHEAQWLGTRMSLH
jgi:hypothetical protein